MREVGAILFSVPGVQISQRSLPGFFFFFLFGAFLRCVPRVGTVTVPRVGTPPKVFPQGQFVPRQRIAYSYRCTPR